MQVLQIIQVVVLGPSLFFIGYQAMLQRQQLRNQVAIQGYKLYHRLDQQYMELLLRADADPELNCIWEPVDHERDRALQEAQRSKTWGAWHAMDSTEKRCYRFVRSALETFEQTYQLYQNGWIDDETWVKWRGWIDIWREVRYFDFVFEDSRPRLIRTFALLLGTIGKPSRARVEEA